ncbi:hypothetical protein [Lentibacillus amyloliquefaciens]|uniref:Lipoprotein n=1 Tax=Lentibacillus amyloliquefaciens TaxID=1472767 RepID=A0A0U4EG02_9BACI|nr:hypothetical protein [Lentibacillus amyloliquefaciens]ALX49497.1 hypothetical protein AOX59_13520 [Lentibacillus amyloliquefaciens]
MKKLIIFGLLLLILVGCNQRSEDLEESINSVVEDKSKGEIDVNAYTNFDWEKAFLFTPYSTTESIEEQLETSFKDKSNIHIRDDIYLLVFLNEDEVVQYAEIKRQGSDFSIKETDKEYLTLSEDVISFEVH